jgi:hypothetical protein
MAWYSDEEYLFRKDSIEKKITARSARSTRTHNGRRGPVKLPSDFMTAKEIRAMNGECKSYPMNKAITWDEFKSWPDEHKVTYIRLLREKFNCPNNALAEMFDVHPTTLNGYLKCLGLGVGKGGSVSGKRTWNKEGFLAWRHGIDAKAVKDSETPIENEEAEENNEPVEDVTAAPAICNVHHLPVIPKGGTMVFENNHADDALDTIKTLLSNVRVNLTVSWEFVSGD